MFEPGLEENTRFSKPQKTVRKRSSVQLSHIEQKTSQNLSNLDIKRGFTAVFGKTKFFGKIFITF